MRFPGFEFLLLSCALANSSCAPPPDMAQERAAVRALWDETNAALAAKDWDRYEQVWLHDSTLQVIHPAQGGWIDGWIPFQRRYQALFASEREFSVTTHRFDVQLSPNADVAWATIQGDLSIDGQSSRQWYVMVARKIAGRWRIALALDAPPPDGQGV